MLEIKMAIVNIVSRLKKRKIVICAGIVVCLFVILQTEISSDHREQDINISCHYNYDGDGLTPIEELSISAKPIFFHETSCKSNLNSRDSCAIESAVRAHPDWQIYVLFSGPISSYTLNVGSFKILKKYPNVHFARVHIIEYSKNTPVEQLVKNGALNKSRWKVEHTSHVLRYLTMYKRGGVYMDLDVIVARPISTLARNWVARETDTEIAAGILAFSRDNVGRNVAEDAIRDISTNYKENDWHNNGPGVVTRVLQKRCSTPHASYMSAATCEGFEVYGPQFFYPIERRNARKYFVPGDLDVQNAYTYYLWGHISKKYRVHRGSPYERLAKRYCPNIYNLYGAQFGH